MHELAVVVVSVYWVICARVLLFFFFQAEDGIRDLVRSRGLGDVYKRQGYFLGPILITNTHGVGAAHTGATRWMIGHYADYFLSLIHI